MSKKEKGKILPGVQVREVFHKEPIRREKVDRNAPCPCGSGKKHKRCCGDEEQLSIWKRIWRVIWPWDYQ